MRYVSPLPRRLKSMSRGYIRCLWSHSLFQKTGTEEVVAMSKNDDLSSSKTDSGTHQDADKPLEKLLQTALVFFGGIALAVILLVGYGIAT